MYVRLYTPDVYSILPSSLMFGESGGAMSSLASLPPLLESLEEGVEEEELSPAELMGLCGGWEGGAAAEEEDEGGRGPFLFSDACGKLNRGTDNSTLLAATAWRLLPCN